MDLSMEQISEALRRSVRLGGDGTIAELLRAGLRDRDDENLYTGDRLAAHAALGREGRRVACDCADAEPGVHIARFLLASQPEAIVAGAYVAAFATHSCSIAFYVAEDDDRGAEALAAAADTLRDAGILANIAVETVRAPFRRNMKGYEEVPTLVLTSETLLNVSTVLRDGAGVYRSRGAPGSFGTKFFQLSGCVNRPGIVEFPLGVSLRDVIQQTGAGVATGEVLKAVMLGGAKGACYTPDELDLPLDFDSVKRHGGTIGSGALAVLGQKDCIVDQAKRSIEVSCYDTCAGCSMGREGSYQLREMVADATKGKSKGGDVELMREIGLGMKAGAACAFGRTAPNILLSTLEKFPEEYDAHMKRRLCRALVCVRYVTFHILPDVCDGCGECVEACPEDAIEGGRRKIHVIDQDACDKCGKCYQVCNGLRQAVVKAGAVKPRTPKAPIPVGSWKG
jgi:NADH:ubiquinone oxidoreductase subunit F (NADH-binding)/Pyruvate/2-oxoacid:ferredoxin oxidoreductase delta subunit